MKRHNRYVYPCSEFDGSDRYIMNCPDSKLCIYQRITLPLSNGKYLLVWEKEKKKEKKLYDMYISFQIFLYNGHGGDSVNCMVTYQYINPLNFFFNQKYLFLLIFFPLPAENIIVKTMDGCTPNTTDNARYAEAGLVKEGCIQHRSLYKPPSSEYCYCSHNLCNGTMTNLSSTVILAILLATALFYNYQWSSLS